MWQKSPGDMDTMFSQDPMEPWHFGRRASVKEPGTGHHADWCHTMCACELRAEYRSAIEGSHNFAGSSRSPTVRGLSFGGTYTIHSKTRGTKKNTDSQSRKRKARMVFNVMKLKGEINNGKYTIFVSSFHVASTTILGGTTKRRRTAHRYPGNSRRVHPVQSLRYSPSDLEPRSPSGDTQFPRPQLWPPPQAVQAFWDTASTLWATGAYAGALLSWRRRGIGIRPSSQPAASCSAGGYQCTVGTVAYSLVGLAHKAAVNYECGAQFVSSFCYKVQGNLRVVEQTVMSHRVNLTTKIRPQTPQQTWKAVDDSDDGYLDLRGCPRRGDPAASK
ncbi:hypothetical protein C8R44DRAFT_725039 [Mycena epipterygia]|nr:hypothetical protein C8R44DRAFT_725039 [Mycena epipterygia]